MIQISKYANSVVVHEDPLNSINHWRYVAVYELVSTKRATTLKQLTEILKLTAEQATTIVNELCKLKILAKSEDGFSATASSIQTLNDIPSSAIVKYHVSITEKAAKSLTSHTVSDREFQNLVMSFSKEQMPSAKQMIRDFVSEFSTKFYNDQAQSEIYSLAVNFFSLERH